MYQAQQVVGAFRLLALLGRGGVAEVWKAEHTSLGSLHAVKFLSVHTENLSERLLLEGRVQATLGHPNIVRVTDVVRERERIGLVMELISGPALERWIHGLWRMDQVEPLFRGICGGVRAAHAAGLVHRDLKPQNVLLATIDGTLVPKVTDFGIARAMEETQGTRTGSLLGTLRFMSPEQLRDASRVDARSDIWALGCILYEMVARRPLVPDLDVVTLYERHRAGGFEPLAEVVPDAPEALIRTVAACLRFDPAERPAHVDAVLGVLDGAAHRTSFGGDGGPRVAGLALDFSVATRPDVQAWRATRPNGEVALVKVVSAGAESDALAHFENEARLGRELQHPAVPEVEVVRAETVRDDPSLILVRRWVSGPTVAEESKTRRYSPEEVWDIVGELLGIVAFLHGKSPAVVHAAIHPSHLVRGATGLSLIGFGRAKTWPRTDSFGGVDTGGAFGWQAPEQLSGNTEPKSDVYAVGVLAVALLARIEPAEWVDGRGRIEWHGRLDLADPLSAVLDSLLAATPAGRATAAEGRAAVRMARTPGRTPASPGTDQRDQTGFPDSLSEPLLAEPEANIQEDPLFHPPVVAAPGPVGVSRRDAFFGVVVAGLVGIGLGGVGWGYKLARDEAAKMARGDRPPGFWLRPTDACTDSPLACGEPVALPAAKLAWNFEGDPATWMKEGPALGTGVNQVDGPMGKALHFASGHGGAHSRDGTPTLGAPEWTLSFWARFDLECEEDKAILFGSGNGPVPSTGALAGVDFFGSPLIDFNGGTMQSEYLAYGPMHVCLDHWQQFAYVFQPGEMRIYMDGALASRSVVAIERAVFGANGIHLGNDPGYEKRGFVGDFDTLSIWDVALTDEQVAALYESTRCAGSGATARLPSGK